MSQSVYRELHPPTAITYCVEAFFTHAASKQQGAVAPNLVVARGTRLEVYSLNYGATPATSSGSHPSVSVPPAVVSQCRMELVGSWQCWGVIEDLAVLRGRGSSGQRDSLVLAARDAKVALVEWDDQLHCLRNGSLHSFEGDATLREGCPCGTGMTINSSNSSSTSSHLSVPPIVAADPNGRCAAALVYGRHLALLPAIQADVLEMLLQEGGAAKGSTSSASVGNSYLVHLAKVATLKLASDCAVRAMTFLHGYTEPVLLLLHETTPTWGGRLREARDTCALSAMSINVRKKRQPVIWSVPQLPSDCSSIMAVPRGGVLVLSQNLLLYYAQGGSCVMAINSNAFAGEVPPKLDLPTAPTFPQFPPRTAAEIQAATAAAADKAANAATAHARQWAVNVHPETVAAAARGAPKAPGMELEADGAVGCWLAGNVALLSLKTGQLLLVALKFEGSAASKMQVVVAGAGPVASCAATLTNNLLFLGSAVGDSLLVRYTSDIAGSSAAGASRAAGYDRSSSFAGSSNEPPGKRRRLAGLGSDDAGGGLEGEGDAAAPAAGGDGFGVSLEEDGEPYRCAMGRSHSAVMPVLLGEGLKQNLKVLDSLMSLGPMRSCAIADVHLRESDVHASLSHTSASSTPKPSSCLIAAVGSDKSGALAIMRRGLVADVITAVPSLQAHGAWTLHYRPVSKQQQGQAAAAAASPGAPGGAQGDEAGPEDAAQAGSEGPGGGQAGAADPSEQHHAFVLLSCGGQNTMVLDAGGAELSELSEDVAYVRDAPTLAVGEIFSATAAVQVTHTTVRMVRGSSELLQELPLTSILQEAAHPAAAAEAAAPAGQHQVCIRYAQVRDPCVVLLLSDATALLLYGDKQRQQLQLLPAALPDLAEAGWNDPLAAVTAACLYTDRTGWLAAAADITADEQDVEQNAAVAAADAAAIAEEDQQQQDAEDAAAAGDHEDALMAEAAAGAPDAEDAAAAPAEAAPGTDSAEQQQDAETAGNAAGAVAAAAAGGPVKAAVAAVAAADRAAADVKAEDSEVGTKSGGNIVVPTEEKEAAAAMDGMEGVDTAMALAAAMEDAGDAAAAAAAAGDKEGAAVATAADSAAAAAAQDAAADVGVPPGLAAGTAEQRAAVAADAEANAAAAADAEANAAAAAEGQPQQQQHAAVLDAGAGKQDAPAEHQQKKQRTAAMRTFCVIVRAGGALQVYALPSMTCVFEDAEAVLGHQTLSPARPPSPYADEDEDGMQDEDLSPSPISELLMECFAGSSGGAVGVPAAAAPLLVMLRDDGSCMAYKAFKPHAANSPLGFRRLPLDADLLPHLSPVQPPADATAAAAAQGELAPPAPGMPHPTAPPCRLVRFDQLATPRLEAPLGPGFVTSRGNTAAGSSSSDSTSSHALPLPQLRYSGVFVCGPRPVWLVVSRGGLVVHPMEADVGQVDAFCAFHNLNCVHGYMAASLAGALNICTLPLQMRLDQPWLTSKLPLRATPQALAYYPEARLLALTTSRVSAPPRPFLPLEPGGDAVAAAAYATADAAVKAAGVEDLHELLLLAPPGCGLPTATYTTVYTSILAAAAGAGASGSGLQSAGGAAAGGAGAGTGSSARAAASLAAAAGWAGLPMWRYPLLPAETVTALKHVSLCEGGDENANPEPFIAVGCSSAYGEDFPAMGRVLLFQVLKEKIYRVEGSSEVISGRLELQREYPGPVTAVESLRGFLLMAIGNKLEMHYKQGNTLVKVTFFDGLQMVSGLALVKDFLLLGQAGHSAAFFRYNCTPDPVTRERQQQLKELSADTERLDAWAVEFMPNASKLSQVMADGGGNLTVFMYDMKNPDSWAGKKLLRRGVAHVGAWISQFQRLRLAVPGDNLNRQGLLACSAQGGLLLLCPLWDEGMFRRLQSLQEELVYQLRHTAGLNPKAFQGRYTRAGPTYGAGFTAVKPLKPLDNWLLQGDLMWSYAGLDLRAQTVIAEAVGVEPAMLLQDLRTLSIAANFL